MESNGKGKIHYTQLPELFPEDDLFHEWIAYRRELPRLIAEGNEGRFVLLKGDAIIGIFDAEEAAAKVGYDRFLREPFMVKQVLSHEPVLRIPWYCQPCRGWKCNSDTRVGALAF